MNDISEIKHHPEGRFPNNPHTSIDSITNEKSALIE